MKRLIIIRILAMLLLGVMLFSALTACVPLDVPDDSEGDNVKDDEQKPQDEDTVIKTFEDAPYYIEYTYNTAFGACYVSDIIVDPDCTEDFTLVIPAKSPDGQIVTKIDIPGFEKLGTPDNVPRVMARADFEALLNRLPQDEFDYQKFLAYYTCYDLKDAKTQKVRDKLLSQEPLLQYCDHGYYALQSVSHEDMVWLSEYLLSKAEFDAEDCETAELAVAQGLMSNRKFSPKRYYDALSRIYHRKAEHIAAIVLPETVNEIVGDPFANCTNATSITTEGTAENYIEDYDAHEQFIAGDPMKDKYIPFERINTTGEFTFEWFYRHSMNSKLWYQYGIKLNNGAALTLLVHDTHVIYAEKTKIKLPAGQTDMRVLDIMTTEGVIVFGATDETGWEGGLEYHYDTVRGETKLQYIVFPVGEHLFVWTIDVDTVPYGDGSWMARMLDISTAHAARGEFVAAVLGETE